METLEHKRAGDQIRIENKDENHPYLKGSHQLNTEPEHNLIVTVMQKIDGIPVPKKNPTDSPMQLSAGDFVALAGDYYTKAGWGLGLTLPEQESNAEDYNTTLINTVVSDNEKKLFAGVCTDLASANGEDIARIYGIGETTYFPFFSALNSIIQEIVYAFTVNKYDEKLTKNEAHFAPWSTRAYIIGHQIALEEAKMAYYWKEWAQGREPSDSKMLLKMNTIKTDIKNNPAKYGFQRALFEQELHQELYYRYHALAISSDLITMHFYSDHFAGGHLGRIGLLRKIMPETFGLWGSILINNMHNEDNTNGLNTTREFTTSEMELGVCYATSGSTAYGDGTYFRRSNDENSNMLINGMDNSLGDIARLLETGELKAPQNYGGLPFLPKVDKNSSQPQPLLIHGKDGKVYYRKQVHEIKILDPQTYEETEKNPTEHGYQKLTTLRAFILVFKLRVLSFLFSPKIVSPHAAKPLATATAPISNIKQSQDALANSVLLTRSEKSIFFQPPTTCTSTPNPISSSPDLNNSYNNG